MLQSHPELQDKMLEDPVRDLNSVPDDIRTGRPE